MCFIFGKFLNARFSSFVFPSISILPWLSNSFSDFLVYISVYFVTIHLLVYLRLSICFGLVFLSRNLIILCLLYPLLIRFLMNISSSMFTSLLYLHLALILLNYALMNPVLHAGGRCDFA